MARISTFYDHIADVAGEMGISVTEAMKRARELGIECVEVVGHFIFEKCEELKAELDASGMGVSCIPAFFEFDKDTDVRAQAEPLLKAAKYLGTDKMMVIPGFFGESDDADTRERKTVQMLECVKELAVLAKNYGVSLCMEDYDSELAAFATSAGMNRFFAACPELSCCFDTGNFRYSAEDELEAFAALKDKITHVHLKDRAYTQPGNAEGKRALDGQLLYPSAVGAGEIRIDAVLKKLKNTSYDGDCVIEHFGAPDMWEYLKSSVQWTKKRI